MWIDDQVLAACDQPLSQAVWVPERLHVVLGRSNQAALELHTSACQADHLPILRRLGGGGAVVLHPGCVIYSLGVWVAHPFRNDHYFTAINQALIETLAARWPVLAALEQQGISDLAIHGRKVAGTSLFRSRGYLLYQASILVEAGQPLMERYLAHPSREPTYRAGKSHTDFVWGLVDVVPGLKPPEVAQVCAQGMPAELMVQLDGELSPADASHCEHLRQRLQTESDT